MPEANALSGRPRSHIDGLCARAMAISAFFIFIQCHGVDELAIERRQYLVSQSGSAHNISPFSFR